MRLWKFALAAVAATMLLFVLPASASAVSNVKVHSEYFNEDVSNFTAGSNTTTMVSFTLAQPLSAGATITLDGPAGMVLPSSPTGGGYQVDVPSTVTGSRPLSAVTFDNNTGVVLTMRDTWSGAIVGDRILVYLGCCGSNVQHPQIAGLKQFSAATSAEPTPVLSANYNVVPGAPAELNVTGGADQSTTVGTAFASPLTLKVTDQFGNAVSGVGVDVDLPNSAPSGLFTTPVESQEFSGTTNASGEVTTGPVQASEEAGSWVATGSTGSLSEEIPLTNEPDTPDSGSVVGGDNQTAKAGGNFAAPLQVQVNDQYDNPVPGEEVTFTAPDTGPTGSFPDDTQPLLTDSNGIAAPTTVTANGVLGAWDATATHDTLGALTFSLTNLVGDPGQIELIDGGGQSAQVNTAFADPLQIAVEDDFGNPITGADVEIEVPNSGAAGTFPGAASSASGVTGGDGIYTSPALTANGVAGSWNAQVDAGPAGSLGVPLTNTAAPVVEPPDTRAPVTTITDGPKAKIKTKKKRVKVSFSFEADEPVSGFQCRLDGELAACTSPAAYKVKKGAHVFEVRSTDEAGNTGAFAKAKFKVVKKKRK
jgi:hypothetical protein